jgi:hypothetical protein
MRRKLRGSEVKNRGLVFARPMHTCRTSLAGLACSSAFLSRLSNLSFQPRPFLDLKTFSLPSTIIAKSRSHGTHPPTSRAREQPVLPANRQSRNQIISHASTSHDPSKPARQTNRGVNPGNFDNWVHLARENALTARCIARRRPCRYRDIRSRISPGTWDVSDGQSL